MQHSPFASTFIYTDQLQEKLKNPVVFNKAIVPVQFSGIFALVFAIMAATIAVLFSVPALWHAVQGNLMLSENYEVRFNTLIGIGLSIVLALFALVSFIVARCKHKPMMQRLYDAYINHPMVCEIAALLKRKHVTLRAYAALPQQQQHLEQALTKTLQIFPQAYKLAYKAIFSANVKYKRYKADQLKKHLQQINPDLQTYDFYFDWHNDLQQNKEFNRLSKHTDTPNASDMSYYLYFEPGLLPMRQCYIRIRMQALS